MAENTTYTGYVDDVRVRTSHQLMTTKDAYEAQIAFACFTKNPFLTAVGVEGFGVNAMQGFEQFAGSKPTGRIVRKDTGGHSITGGVFADSGNSHHVGRLGAYSPELVEGGDIWAYSWLRLVSSRYIPTVDIQDNSKKYIDLKLKNQQEMMSEYVQAFNYAILGSSSAPDDGPSNRDCDLPSLISVTQSAAVNAGAISAANAYWQNGIKDCSGGLGGGGDLDRPILLPRYLITAKNARIQLAEVSDDYMYLATEGAWTYLWQLAYADTLTAGQKGAFGTAKKYDAAGIEHFVYGGAPVLWDPAVQVPTGATASTEAIYGIHIPSYFISLRTEESFRFTGWETPREHDKPAGDVEVASVLTRYTPGVSQRRPHFVLYDIPAHDMV